MVDREETDMINKLGFKAKYTDVAYRVHESPEVD